MIDDLLKTKKSIIPVPEGDVLHGMKAQDKGFQGFGEVYISKIKHKAIKGWKKHTRMTCNFLVPFGEVKVVIFDEGKRIFDETILSTENYVRLTIPPSLWVGFQGLYGDFSILLNIASMPHDPNETHNKTLSEIHYPWESL